MFDHEMHAGLVKEDRTLLSLSAGFIKSLQGKVRKGELSGKPLSVNFYKKLNNYISRVDFEINLS